MRSTAVGALLCAACALRAQSIEQAVAEAEALGVRVGVMAVEQDGAIRYQRRAHDRFAPASNLKLLAAAAVLSRLHEDYEFRTRFVLDAGRLVVHGGGDPNWITGSPYGAEALCRGVAAGLQRLGALQLRGLAIDPGPFTGPDRPATWPADQRDAFYCAPTGACVLDQGTFTLRIEKGDGDARVALVAPSLQMPVTGRIRMAPKQKGAVYGALDLGDGVRVSGSFWADSPPVQIRVAVRDPAAWFERALGQALAASGVRTAADAPLASGLVYEHTTPLAPALERMLRDSSNFDAEQCVRVLGATQRGDGSLRGGVAALREAIAPLAGAAAADLDGSTIADGSGLSAQNAVTPALLVAVLHATLGGPHADAYLRALPVAGENGTLERRFVGSAVAGRVRAKTGWIRGASALSGVLVRRDGSRCLFSILMNYDPARAGLNHRLKALQEAIVEALDGRGAERQ